MVYHCAYKKCSSSSSYPKEVVTFMKLPPKKYLELRSRWAIFAEEKISQSKSKVPDKDLLQTLSTRHIIY